MPVRAAHRHTRGPRRASYAHPCGHPTAYLHRPARAIPAAYPYRYPNSYTDGYRCPNTDGYRCPNTGGDANPYPYAHAYGNRRARANPNP